ncbi:MAG: hypothetical protein K0R08_2021 [Solimicrobium sp.]|jgi:hypothetical protein|nr:hypothetical protein [Solimicrobium sp.]
MQVIAQRTRNFLAETAPIAASVGLSGGGLLLGLGWTSKADSPPTLSEFQQALTAVCNPLNSGDPNNLLCQVTDLASVSALFVRVGPAAIISGSILIGGVASVGLLLACYRQCCSPEENEIPVENISLRGLKTFINNNASIATGIALTIGEVLLGNGLASYVERSSPLSQFQQVMNAICVPYPANSDTALLCNVTKLGPIAGIFNQTGFTELIMGASLVGLVGVSGLAYACYQSKSDDASPERDALMQSTL